jgi:hypothetical protein
VPSRSELSSRGTLLRQNMLEKGFRKKEQAVLWGTALEGAERRLSALAHGVRRMTERDRRRSKGQGRWPSWPHLGLLT